MSDFQVEQTVQKDLFVCIYSFVSPGECWRFLLTQQVWLFILSALNNFYNTFPMSKQRQVEKPNIHWELRKLSHMKCSISVTLLQPYKYIPHINLTVYVKNFCKTFFLHREKANENINNLLRWIIILYPFLPQLIKINCRLALPRSI